MYQVRKSTERGHANHGWLDTYHTFSFADYYDENHHHFRNLRVINEDRVLPGAGFDMHGHRDMEIVTYIISGELEHRDDMNNRLRIKRGEIQRMTAGTGVLHSEYNASQSELVHLLQIWIFPREKNLKPSYQQKPVAVDSSPNRPVLIVDEGGTHAALTINADVKIYASKLEQEKAMEYRFNTGRHGWLQMIKGEVLVDSHTLMAGDGLAISDESTLKITAQQTAEFLFFDLP